MRRLAIAALAAHLSAAALADPALLARPGSPIIEHTLGRPFADDLAAIPSVVELLRLSGNEREADLLEGAHMRARTLQLIEARPALPRTVREAIAAEDEARAFGELTQHIFGRVVLRPAREGIRAAPGPTARTTVLLEVKNGLGAPLQRASIVVREDGPAIGLTCDLQPPLPAGQSRAVACWRDGATQNELAVLARVAQRGAPHHFSIEFIETPALTVTATRAYREGDGSARETARAQLASARCEDKGTCDRAASAAVTATGSRSASSAVPATAASAPQPAPDQTRATLDSAFIREVLGWPMPSAATEALRLLHYSGNQSEVELLRRAQGRAAVSQLMGETPRAPATVADAIALETAAVPALAEIARKAASRVVVTYPPGPVQVSVTPEPPHHSRLAVVLRATNGLPAPVKEIVVMAGSNDLSRGPDALGLRCRPLGTGTLAPGASADLACEGGRATAQIDAAVQALSAREPLPVHTVVTPTVSLLDGHVAVRAAEDPDGDRAAMARLAALPCEQKGSCALVAAEQRRSWKKQHASTLLAGSAAGVFLLAWVIAWRTRPKARENVPGTVGAVAVLLFSVYALAVAWLALVPGGYGYIAMVGFIGVYYGAVPFLLVLAALAASLLAGSGTRLRVFAVAFGALSSVLVGAAFLLG